MVGDNFKCIRCKKPFRDGYALRAHLNAKVKCKAVGEVATIQSWYCETCQQSCSTKGNFMTHLKTKTHERLTRNLEVQSEPLEDKKSNSRFEILETEKVIRIYKSEDCKKFIVRKSCETPYRLHVIDLIGSIIGDTSKPAEALLLRLKDSNRALATICKTTNFGNKTGAFGVDVEGVVAIVNILPGERAANFRDKYCDEFIKYLGGNSIVIAGIAKNITIYEEEPQELWTRVFTEDADNRCDLMSVTNVVDTRETQCYFALPKGSWKDLKVTGQRGENAIVDLSVSSRIIKFGYNGYDTGRHDGHAREYGGTSRILDSLPTPVATAAEMKFKDWLKNEGLLLSGMHENKATRDTELIAVKSQEDYEYYVETWRKIIESIEAALIPMEVAVETERTRQEEEKTKQKQIELEILRLQMQIRMQ